MFIQNIVTRPPTSFRTCNEAFHRQVIAWEVWVGTFVYRSGTSRFRNCPAWRPWSTRTGNRPSTAEVRHARNDPLSRVRTQHGTKRKEGNVTLTSKKANATLYSPDHWNSSCALGSPTGNRGPSPRWESQASGDSRQSLDHHLGMAGTLKGASCTSWQLHPAQHRFPGTCQAWNPCSSHLKLVSKDCVTISYRRIIEVLVRNRRKFTLFWFRLPDVT